MSDPNISLSLPAAGLLRRHRAKSARSPYRGPDPDRTFDALAEGSGRPTDHEVEHLDQ
jgi:hypothetical protein